MKRGAVLFIPLLAAWCMLPVAQAHADAPENDNPCQLTPTVTCYHDAATALGAQDRHRDALDLLKIAAAQHPDAPSLMLLRVRSYLDMDNAFWATRTLQEWLDRHPDDCEAAAWLAWQYAQEGDFDDARARLETPSCRQLPPHSARKQVILAFVADYEGDADLSQIHARKARLPAWAHPEDRAVIRHLLAADPAFIPPLSGRLDLALGHTTNATAGTPTDRPGQQAPSSPVLQQNTWLRFVSQQGRMVRPALEVDWRALLFTAADARDNTWMLFGARPGFVIGGHPNALLAYHYEGMLLFQADRYDPGPVWFYAAHRGEFEMSPRPWLTLFAGAGRRNFRELGRSRWEFDGGLGTDFSPAPWLGLMSILSGRIYNADKNPYDQRGFSAVLHLNFRLPKSWQLRTGLSWSLDNYHRSAGYFDAAAPDTHRRDILLKPSAALFAPPIRQALRIGLTYDFSQRFSTAASYAYRDHRTLLKLQWSFSAGPRLPRALSHPGHVPLPYGVVGAGETKERIQDMLRQDEATQRSSSCVN